MKNIGESSDILAQFHISLAVSVGGKPKWQVKCLRVGSQQRNPVQVSEVRIGENTLYQPASQTLTALGFVNDNVREISIDRKVGNGAGETDQRGIFVQAEANGVRRCTSSVRPPPQDVRCSSASAAAKSVCCRSVVMAKLPR